jgi:hypothetical protein
MVVALGLDRIESSQSARLRLVNKLFNQPTNQSTNHSNRIDTPSESILVNIHPSIHPSKPPPSSRPRPTHKQTPTPPTHLLEGQAGEDLGAVDAGHGAAAAPDVILRLRLLERLVAPLTGEEYHLFALLDWGAAQE